jgi:hypothetical protein
MPDAEIDRRVQFRIAELGSLVAKRNAREFSSENDASGCTPARASSGRASARMRPLGTAMMIWGMI